MSEMHAWSTVMSAVYGTSWLATIAIEIAFVVVATTVVRRQRPDAFKPLLAWAVASLAWGVLSGVSGMILPLFAARDGIDSLLRMQAINAAIGIAVHVALAVMLVRGLVALAQPPKPVDVGGAPPYR